MASVRPVSGAPGPIATTADFVGGALSSRGGCASGDLSALGARIIDHILLASTDKITKTELPYSLL